MKTSNGPEGTLPFVELNGSQISDTEIIIRELTRAFSKESMEAGMDDHQKGVARAIERMTEDSMLRFSSKNIQISSTLKLFSGIHCNFLKKKCWLENFKNR